jgi:hypothetical protein
VTSPSRADPWRSGDLALTEATIRLVGADGLFLGTGVIVAPDGCALTCHHVVRDRSVIQAIDQSGARWNVSRRSDQDDLLNKFDVAVIELSSSDEQKTLPRASPIALRASARNFLTRAMLSSASVTSSAPFTGIAEGETDVVYWMSNGWSYGPNPLRLIRGLTVEEGMSGSPVWDEDLEAVVGLVAVGMVSDKNIGGFTISLEKVATSAIIQRLYQKNLQSVARFGVAPNRIAVWSTAKQISAATVDRLIARGIYLPGKTIVREQFAPVLAEFLASRKLALPIIGPAGQGKSSLLAQFTERYSEAPIFLLRSAEVHKHEKPFAVLNRMIEEAGSTGSRFNRFEYISAETWGSNSSALLVLDAINELPFTEIEIADEWLPDLLGAVCKAGMKLMFACRPEFFQLVAQASYKDVLFDTAKVNKDGKERDAGDRRNWFVVDGFESRELNLAREAYGVPANLPQMITRRPLLLRLAAQAIERRSPFVTRSGVIQSHLNDLGRRIAKMLGIHPLTVGSVLCDLAVATAREEAGVLPPSNSTILAQGELIEKLTKENIIEQVPSGYRFVFDEVYEYVLATAVNIEIVAGVAGISLLSLENRFRRMCCRWRWND